MRNSHPSLILYTWLSSEAAVMRSLVCLLAILVNAVAVPLEERQQLEFDYIVVGSGAGGGPLASRLARVGNSVLLFESGDDQGSNYNYSVSVCRPAYQTGSDGYIGARISSCRHARQQDSMVCASKSGHFDRFQVLTLPKGRIREPLPRPNSRS